MQVKDMPVQIKAGPEDGLTEGEFSAYASVFGNVDSYGDIVVKGAFANDLQRWQDSGNPIPLLFGHNMSDPDFNIGSVVKAVEDDHGLLVTAQLDLENPKAMQVYRMLKGRRVNQMSFAYDVLDDGQVEVAGGAKANELRELRLYEVSVVTIGANQETEVLAVKANAEALADAVKVGRVLAQKHIDSLRSAQEAIGAVIAAAEGANDQEKASGDTEAKSDAIDEEPIEAKSPVPDEEPKSRPSVDALAAQATIYALQGRRES
jgi:HK97 family phage prohead protease